MPQSTGSRLVRKIVAKIMFFLLDSMTILRLLDMPVVGGDTFSPLPPNPRSWQKGVMSSSSTVHGGQYDPKYRVCKMWQETHHLRHVNKSRCDDKTNSNCSNHRKGGWLRSGQREISTTRHTWQLHTFPELPQNVAIRRARTVSNLSRSWIFGTHGPTAVTHRTVLFTTATGSVSACDRVRTVFHVDVGNRDEHISSNGATGWMLFRRQDVINVETRAIQGRMQCTMIMALLSSMVDGYTAPARDFLSPNGAAAFHP